MIQPFQFRINRRENLRLVFARLHDVPEDNPKTGTKYIVRKPTKGMKVAEKLRLKKYDPVLKKHVWFIEKKMPPHSK